MKDDILQFELIKTNRRLTFEISYQREDTRYRGPDEGDFFTFTASNGYEVISRSRMDIQTERLWLLGAKENERSGTMVFSSNEKRDRAYIEFLLALEEWETCVRQGGFVKSSLQAGRYYLAQFIGNSRDLDVDAQPRPYLARELDDILYLCRVALEPSGEPTFAYGQARSLKHFVRVGAELAEQSVAQWLAEQSPLSEDWRRLSRLVARLAPDLLALVDARMPQSLPA
jgi:hypothetical protein